MENNWNLPDLPTKKLKKHQMLIAGFVCGVQFCGEFIANVFISDADWNAHYVRLDLVNKVVLKPERMNPAYDFVKANYSAFEAKCTELK